ncbi:MAG: tRNA dihydrouridine(20/20a) synthase DusA [Rhizobiales bacterium]|nr:tRNA dihydrouridine(20/20a) synthase DusA [Hyphomicrobiales bacterium]
MQDQPHKFSVAPMMEWTDRHCRAFHRGLSRRARLYTEMVTAEAVVHGPRERLLGFASIGHPVALQLGGADPARMAEAARIGAAFGYDEIDINVGCPSDRVQSGAFGAALMAEPGRVAAIFRAMADASPVEVTVKCRIGIDDQDAEADFQHFVETVADAGCRTFIVHARKAWLQGLSPKENRQVPPLDYERVYRLKAARPDLTVVINGGIGTLDEAVAHLAHVDGVMLGRAAYETPAILADVDTRLFGDSDPAPSRHEALERYLVHIGRELALGTPLHAMTRHVLGLFSGLPGGRLFRRHISERAVRPGAGIEVVREAMDLVARELARAQDREARRGRCDDRALRRAGGSS